MSNTAPAIFTVSGDTFTYWDRNYRPHSFTDADKINEAITAAQSSDYTALEALCVPAVALTAAVTEAAPTTVTIVVTPTEVVVNGERLAGPFVDQVLTILGSGNDVSAWVRFIENLYKNPSSDARNELADWVATAQMPITADGCFIAWKRVNHDYTDCHTGKIDNSPGKTVEMPRSEVDPDRRKHCSVGLHFCSFEYLASFGGARTVALKVNPADVVSIPDDYNYTKGRTWSYEVLAEVDRTPTAESTYGANTVVNGSPDSGWSSPAVQPVKPSHRELVARAQMAYRNLYPGDCREDRLYTAGSFLGTSITSFNELTNEELKALINGCATGSLEVDDDDVQDDYPEEDDDDYVDPFWDLDDGE